jgi:imidazolonepropionase
VPYEEIARAGGGIQSTVRATRAADAVELMAAATIRATRLMSEGVTTLEVKSGYGLDFDTERRMLEVARALGRTLPVTIRTTFLGLHALPPEYRDRRADFVAEASGPWLDRLMSLGLIDAVDAFCENIAFTLAETEIFLRAAREKGLRAHVHAGQLSDMGAAELAARYGALSRRPERWPCCCPALTSRCARPPHRPCRRCARPECRWRCPPMRIPAPRRAPRSS